MFLRAASAIGSSCIVLVLALSSCNSAPTPRPDRSPIRTTTASSGPAAGKTACDLITSDVIRSGQFSDAVVRRTKSSGLGKNGSSACSFGDDPNPNTISPNFVELLVLPPAALRAQHSTADKQAKATAYPCTPSSVESTGAEDGIGMRAYFCVSAEAHAPAGGWLQHGTAYLLEVGTPQADNGTTAQRRRLFTAVARAISRNVDR